MDAAAEVLVIIVSSVLAVFLLVSIILGIYLIKLTSEIRKITKTAQNTVNHIDTAVVGVSRLASPVYVAELINKLVKKYTKKESK